MKKQNCLNMIVLASLTLLPLTSNAEDVAAPDASKPCVREIQVGDSPYYDYEDYANGSSGACPTGYSNNKTYLDAQAAKLAAQQAADKAAADKAAADKAAQQQQQPQQAQQPQQQQQQPQQQQAQPQQQQQQPETQQSQGDKNNNGSPDVSTTPDKVAGGDGCSGSSIGASGETTDAAGQGNCQAKKAIKQSVDSLAKLKINNASSLKSAYQRYQSAWKSCVADQSSAAQSCLENMSPEITNAQNAVNALTGNLAGASDNASCETYKNSMNTVDQGLTNYTTKCGAAKAQCESSCQQALSALDQMKSLAQSAQCTNSQDMSCTQALPGAKQAVPPAVNQEKQVADLKAMAGKKNVCEQKYSRLMQNAQNGIARAKNDAAVGRQCGSDTFGGPASATTGGAPADRGIASESGTNYASTPLATTNTPVQQEVQMAAAAASTSDDKAIAAAAEESRAEAASLDDKGPLASAAAEDMDSPYRAYLPGGAKDPTQAAGDVSIKRQITKPGYKSNWEKTSERFTDMQATFLDEK